MGATPLTAKEYSDIRELLRDYTGDGSAVQAVAKYTRRSPETVRMISLHSTWNSYVNRRKPQATASVRTPAGKNARTKRSPYQSYPNEVGYNDPMLRNQKNADNALSILALGFLVGLLAGAFFF